LGRNNFAPGTAFSVGHRPGRGLILRREVIGSHHVSSRRGSSLLSYEAADLESQFGGPAVRVRIHVGQIIVTPLLRYASILRPASEVWLIQGTSLFTPEERLDLLSPRPLSLSRTAAEIQVCIDTFNIVYATELIGNQKPARVVLSGNSTLQLVVGQFLKACGYGVGESAGQYFR
jgi:hypothetical protein